MKELRTKSKYGSLLIILVTLLGSCQSNDEAVIPITVEPYANVDPELVPHFVQFEQEALARGFAIDLTAAGITGVIQEITEENVVGQCTYSSQIPGKVTIDIAFWAVASGLFREFIVFHELGHCSLKRHHLDDAYPNGQCVSIMRSGLGECWDSYTNRSRADYLDELFFPEVIPDHESPELFDLSNSEMLGGMVTPSLTWGHARELSILSLPRFPSHSAWI